MTIDERLERLTERHEALTQSVESLYRDIQEMKAASEAQAAATTRNFEIVLDSIRSLERIAASHEHRISQIEGEE